jgi:prevent-host-death family protein
MTIIGLKELREHTTEIAERVSRGESFTVVKRSKPIFNLTPATGPSQELDSWLHQYIAKNRPLLDALADK